MIQKLKSDAILWPSYETEAETNIKYMVETTPYLSLVIDFCHARTDM